jgi:hypothetical protein
MRYKLENNTFKCFGSDEHTFPLYESNIDPILRVTHLRDILTAGWIKVNNFSESEDSEFLKCNWKNISNCENDLENATSSVPFFTLKGHKCRAKVVHVYDGDTVHLVFEFLGQLFKWHTRIAHVDTPELRTKNLEEKKLGYETRDKLIEYINDKTIHS